MNKFTFKLPDRLKMTVERNGRVRSLTFHSKTDLELKLLVKNVKELLDCKSESGTVSLKDYLIQITHCADGVRFNVFGGKNINTMHYDFTINYKDFKKFMKVCKEVYTDEQK